MWRPPNAYLRAVRDGYLSGDLEAAQLALRDALDRKAALGRAVANRRFDLGQVDLDIGMNSDMIDDELGKLKAVMDKGKELGCW
jgi:hypothetical protein